MGLDYPHPRDHSCYNTLMTIIDSIILGIIEGATEFLPISSTGHLILGGRVLGIPETDFLKSFEIIIQLGAIAAVLVVFWSSFWKPDNLKKIIVGSLPTAFIGFGFYKIIKNNLLGSEMVVLWALLLGGLFLILFELFYRGPDVPEEEIQDITYGQAFYVGIFQALAVIPGVSRSAASIIGGLALGIPRKTIVQFSFMLAVPTILGATGLDIVQSEHLFTKNDYVLLGIGFVTAFIVAIAAIKFLIRYVQKNNFMPFGVYRVVLALLFFFFII